MTQQHFLVTFASAALATFALTAVSYSQNGPPARSAALAPAGPHQKTDSRGKPLDAGVPLFLPAFYAFNQYFGQERAIAVGDVNGDGRPDLAIGGSGFYCGGIAGVLLGNGDGTFQPPNCYDAGGNEAIAISIADMNGDGKPDLIVAGPCDNANSCATGIIGVLLGNGTGTFQPVVSNTNGIVGAGLSTLAVGDVNGDGRPDVVTFNGASGTVLVLLGNGDGTLQPPVSYNPPYGDPPSPNTGNMGGGGLDSTILVDINGDGKLDIVLLSFCVAGSDCSSGLVGYLLGNGDGTFQTSSTSQPLLENTFRTQAYLTNGMAVADVNGDGVLDIVAASQGPSSGDGVASVLIGIGAGAFLPAVTYDSGGEIGQSAGVADVNGDGKPDLIVLNSSCPVSMNCSDSSSVAVLLGNGDGTFQTAQSYTSGTYAQGPMILADVNGDGVQDVVANANQLFVMLGTLGKTIPTTTSFSSSLNPSFFGQVVTLTASTTPLLPSPPTGSVTFNDGSSSLGSVPISSGMASLSTSALIAGTHSITATYSGDASFSGSTSAPVSQVVNVSPSTTGLISSVNPSVSGAPVTFTATVSSSFGGTPTGSVTFKNGTSALGSKTLTSGAANFTTTNLPEGSNSITAVYGGNGNYAGSTSMTVVQVVTAAPPPTVISLSPISGTGLTQTFTAVYADPNGTSDLSSVLLVFNSSLKFGGGCAVLYAPATNKMYLYNNAGTALLSTAVTPGSSASVSNSQCTLTGTGSTFNTSGNNLTLNVALSFTSTFVGDQDVFLHAAGKTSSSGWPEKGIWLPASAGPPAVVSLSPSSGTGLTQTFTMVYTDPNGTSDLSKVLVLFNATLKVSGACYVAFVPASGEMYLYNDAGTAVLTPGIAPGSSASVSNSQCTLAGTGSSFSASGDNVTLNVALTFSPSFTGRKDVFLDAVGKVSNSGWVQKGTWTP